MKLLDVYEYTCSYKIGKQDNVAKAPSAGNSWHMVMCYLLYMSPLLKYLFKYSVYLLHRNQYFSEKTTRSQMIEVL